VVKLTALDPRLSLARQPLGLRRVSRAAALVTLLCIAAELGMLWLPSTLPQLVRSALDWAALISLAGTIVVATLYLACLAERAPDPRLARRTRRAAWGFTLCLPGPLLLGLGFWARAALPPSPSVPQLALWSLPILLGGVLSLLGLVFLSDIKTLWRAYWELFRSCRVESRRLWPNIAQPWPKNLPR
jgi:hypothetical protein